MAWMWYFLDSWLMKAKSKYEIEKATAGNLKKTLESRGQLETPPSPTYSSASEPLSFGTTECNKCTKYKLRIERIEREKQQK
eukprot:gene16882-5201_t